jgi:hypothetical protein
MPLAPVGPVMVIAEVIPKALAPEVLLPEVDRLMVAAPPAVRLAAKTMVSAPAAALAVVMASLKEVTLGSESTVSAVVVTVMVAGTILPSRLRSSSRGEPESLRAFLFWELLKSLRKELNMESVLYKSLKNKQIAERSTKL